MLHRIDPTGYSKAKRWCGPGAVATLTGCSLTDATEQLTRIHGGHYDELEGVYPEHVIIALNERGYRAKEIDIIGRYPELTHGPTLARFLRGRPVMEQAVPMLIELSTHFVSAHLGYACDNWTMRPVPIPAFPKPGRLVKSAWVVA